MSTLAHLAKSVIDRIFGHLIQRLDEVLAKEDRLLQQFEHSIQKSDMILAKEDRLLQQFKHLVQQSDEIHTYGDRLLQWIEEQLSPRQQTIEWQTYHSMLMQQAQLREVTIQYCDTLPLLEKISGIEIVRKNRDIRLISEYNLALDSNDYLHPESTTEGCMRHPRLCQKAETLFGHDINFLDVGCGGAALVFDFAVRGHLGIGLDGSDQCRKSCTGYWPLLPNNLFTCDITKPFTLTTSNDTITKFHLITMWEVYEHIAEKDLNAVMQNIKKTFSARRVFYRINISVGVFRHENGCHLSPDGTQT